MSEKPPSYEHRFDTAGAEKPRGKPPRKGRGGALEFVVILAVSFLLVFGFVRPFVVEAFYIPSESMVHTLEIGDRVLVNKFIYDFTDPERGDIAVFKSVESGPAPEGGVVERIQTYLRGERWDRREDLIKRVVAVPGDTVEVKNGNLFVNGERQAEPYVNRVGVNAQPPFGPAKVPEGRYFFMGDNRANSRDSRYFGAVPEENIEGEAFLRFWPISRIGTL